MSDKIMLDQPRALNGRILLAPSKTCFNNIEKSGRNAEETLRRLSEAKTFIMWCIPNSDQDRGRKGRYVLYTRNGVYGFTVTDNAALLLTSFREATLRDNNTCLKQGVSVCPSDGVTMSIKMNDAHQIFSIYHNGRRVNEMPAVKEANPELIRLLDAAASAGRSKAPAREEKEEYKLPEKAEEYMYIAEAYTQTDADIELAKAQQTPPVVYWDFHAAASYERLDRTAYTVFVDDYDTEVYKADTKVQIELNEEKILSATIVQEGEEKGDKTLTLLFDDQVSFSELPKSGQIKLSYSDIQNEVRQDVIDGIRKGETPAGYLADVLGGYKTSGVTSKDLSQLDASLRSKKYPPNQSQIDAIHRGIETNDILLVLGPPGTGKTTVILEWVKYFIKQEGKRVLISSQNNKAVDNVLERLTQEKDISAIRAGNESKVQANMYPYLLENRLGQLREDVGNTVGSNLEKLGQIDSAYQDYLRRIDTAGESGQRVSRMQEYLNGEADKRYLGCRNDLLEQQQYREKLAGKMKREIRSIHFCEMMMVDPVKHPILRKLLTPLRGFFRNRLHNKLQSYEEDYSSYMRSLSRSSSAYSLLVAMPKDQALLEIAEQVLAVEKEWEAALDGICSPIDDSMVWPERGWPEISRSFTAKELADLRSDVASRRERVKALEAASKEWNDHIMSQSNYALSDLLMESVDLVGGTCIGINSQRKFANIDFDVTIIDESGQIQIHNALVPMSRSPKVIMLGDHLQIPPMAEKDQVKLCEESGIDSSLLSTSLFERLYENLPERNKALLDTQYRMPAQIADLLSEWFYDGKYKSFEGKRNMQSICPGLFRSPFVVVSTSDAGKRRFEYKPTNGAGNNYEADLIISMVAALMSGEHGEALTAEDFGIISPYSEQVENIRRKLRRAMPGLSKTEIHDMVASLDSFQGQERSIILYSCTRSNRIPSDISRIGFLRELRRLNVALSRPLKELVFVGDIDFLSSCGNGEGRGSEKEFSEFIRLMKKRAQENGEFLLSGELQKRLEAE